MITHLGAPWRPKTVSVSFDLARSAPPVSSEMLYQNVLPMQRVAGCHDRLASATFSVKDSWLSIMNSKRIYGRSSKSNATPCTNVQANMTRLLYIADSELTMPRAGRRGVGFLCFNQYRTKEHPPHHHFGQHTPS